MNTRNQTQAPLNSANDPTADTGDGFLVGVQPAQPRMQEAYTQQTNAAGQVSQPIQVSADQPMPVPTSPPPGYFTQEDLEKVRQEEKSKLYGRLESMDEQMKRVQA